MALVSKSREEEIAFFTERFRVPRADLLSFVDYYNADFSRYDNRVYEHIGSRIAHWWNYANHGWFDRRIDLGLAELERLVGVRAKRVVFVDIGFSVPYAYTYETLINSNSLTQVLVDKEDSASTFFEAIKSLYGIANRDQDTALILDVESPDHRAFLVDEIARRWKLERAQEVLIFASEVIEHLHDVSAFWRLCDEVGFVTGKQPLVYVTLPIGLKIPSHTMEYRNASDALAYLSTEIGIQDKWVLKPILGTPTSPYLEECVCVLGYYSSN